MVIKGHGQGHIINILVPTVYVQDLYMSSPDVKIMSCGDHDDIMRGFLS